MFLGVKSALLRRLTGASYDDVDAALRRSPDDCFRAIADNRNYGGGGLRMLDPHRQDQPYRPVGQEVPVLPFGLEGTSHGIIPALTVVGADQKARDTEFFTNEDICEGIAGTEKEIIFPDGTVHVGYNLQRRRVHPRSYDLMFTLRLWARHENELFLLADALYENLDFKGYLAVRLRDGAELTYDTEITSSEPVVVPPGIISPEDAGEFSQVLMYRVEAYADNSHTGSVHRTITSRETTGKTF